MNVFHKIKNWFSGLIGQEAVISDLNKELTVEAMAYAGKCKPVAHRAKFFAGNAGLGKSKIAKLLAQARAEIYGGEHRYLFVPSGTTRPQLIAMFAENIHNRPATIFYDEAHDLDRRLLNMIKPVLETERQVEDIKLSSESIITANPFHHLHIFASNEDCKDTALFGPGSRTDTKHFVAYSEAEKRKLLLQQAAIEDIKIAPDAVEYLCERVWPNGRAIVDELSNQLVIEARLYGNKFDLKAAKDLCNCPAKENRRFLLGLDYSCMRILQYLSAETKGKLVSEVAFYITSTPKKASYYLQWLASLKLTQTLGNGRKALADAGALYLENHKKLQIAASSAAKAKATKAAKSSEKGEEKPETPQSEQIAIKG